MAIIDVKNPWKRKALVIAWAIPSYIVIILCGAILGAIEHLSHLHDAMVDAWHGLDDEPSDEEIAAEFDALMERLRREGRVRVFTFSDAA